MSPPPTVRGVAMAGDRLEFIRQQAAKYPSVMAQMALECAEEIVRLRAGLTTPPPAVPNICRCAKLSHNAPMQTGVCDDCGGLIEFVARQ